MFLSLVIETDRHCVILISQGKYFFLLTLVAKLTFRKRAAKPSEKTVRDSRVVKSIETVAESYILTFSETTINKREYKAKKVDQVTIRSGKKKKTKAPNTILAVNRKENILKNINKTRKISQNHIKIKKRN